MSELHVVSDSVFRLPSRLPSNSRHRTPEVESILRIPGADGGIGHGKVQEREKPGILLQRVSQRRANLRRDRFQWPGGVSVPEPSAQNRAICV